MAGDWDMPGDVRGVIMYLPPKYWIRRSLRDQIKDMGDDVFGHPVVIQAIRGTVDTATVDIFPITSHGKKGPYRPGRPGVPKHKDCLPIPLDPELRRQDTDLSLDLAGDRETLLTPSGVRIEKTYTVPYQSLKYWHDAKSISTGPRLTRHSYGKMMRVAHELARKLKVMSSPNWRADPTASPPEMDFTSDFIENQVMSGPAERNTMSGNWREIGSSASYPRMNSDVETSDSSPLTTASTPTLSTPTTPDTLTTVSTADTPITPMSLPDSCTATPPTIPSSPLPSLGGHGRTSNVVRSFKRLVYTRAVLVRCRGEAASDTSSKQ